MPRDVAQHLAASGVLEPGAHVLDVGAGTGRVAIAFASVGYQVTAIDPAPGMLSELRVKAREHPVRLLAGEGARLPFARSRFDAVILARVLYLMPDWKAALREVCGVLKPGGCLFHEWGNGPGARSEAEVDAVLIGLGFVRSKKLPIGPGPDMTLHDFIARVTTGEFSYVWNIPPHVQESCIPLRC